MPNDNEIGFRLTSDSSDFMSAYAQAGKSVDALSTQTEAFNDQSKSGFKQATAAVEEYSNEIKEGTKSTGKMIEENNKLGKSKNAIAQLKAEIKFYTAEAFKAGEGSKAFTENLAKAGKLKDELGDITAAVNALNGSLGQNLGKAAGESIGLVASGYEGLLGVQSLVSAKSEEFEAILVKLQSLNAISKVAEEFGGLRDKITEIKLGFSPVLELFKDGASGIVDSYSEANGTLKDFFSNFKGNAKSVFSTATGYIKSFATNTANVAKSIGTGFVSFFANFGTNMKTFAASAKAGINTVGAALKANPLGIILTGITLIIGAFVLLKDKVKPIAAVFEYLGKIVDGVVETFEKLGEALGLTASAAEKQAEATLKNSAKIIEGIEKRYDFEIKKAQAAGKETIEQERAKLNEVAQTAGKHLSILVNRKREAGKLNEEEAKQFEELQNKIVESQQEFAIVTIKHQKELADKQKENQKKHDEDAKRALEKRKQLQEQFNSALLDLFKKAQAADLEGLSGKEKIEKQKQIADQELVNLRAQLEKKGKELNKNFKFTNDQEDQFGKIKTEINRKYNADLLQDDIRIATERAALALKEVQNNKSALDSKLKTFELEQQLKEAEIALIKKPAGQSDEDFEAIKQKAIINIKKQAAIDSLDIRTKEIDAENDLLVQQTQNEINILLAKGDKASEIEANRLNGTVSAIIANGETQKAILKANTDALINESNKQIDQIQKGINERSHAINWIQVLGLDSEADLQKVKQGLKQFETEFTNALSSIIATQQAALDMELDANQQKIDSSNKLIDQRQNEIDSLKGALENEQGLREEGLANNTDLINSQIALKLQQIEAEKAAQQKALEEEARIKAEKKKMAKEQAILDTISQGSNLLTASTDIYKSLAPLGPIGIAGAVITIGAMLTAFAAQRIAIFQNLNKGFAEGGYTGDGSKYEYAGPAHKGEFVITKEKTNKNWDLLQGLHMDDSRLIELGIRDLIKDKGISLIKDVPNELSSLKSQSRLAQLNAVLNSDNSGVEKRLDNMELHIIQLVKQGNKTINTLPDGSIITTEGSSTRVVRKG